MSDLISRAAVIYTICDELDKIDHVPQWVYDRLEKALKQLPSAQPEIIRCRNCKFASGDSRICMKFGHSPIGELDFCAWAERRTDETANQ